jgi:hypothetical protein
MVRRTSRALAAAGLAALLLTAGIAAAEPPAEVAVASEAGHGEAERGWRYDTYYLFPLTRHMDEAGISPGWRIPLYPFTLAIDVAGLPAGAIAGLAGE